MVYRESLKLQSRDRAVSFHDVTEQVKEITAKSGMKNGICVVYSAPHHLLRHHAGMRVRHVHDGS